MYATYRRDDQERLLLGKGIVKFSDSPRPQTNRVFLFVDIGSDVHWSGRTSHLPEQLRFRNEGPVDTQIQPTVAANPRQRVVREATEPAHVQPWPSSVDEPGCVLACIARKSELSVRAGAAPCGFEVPTQLAGPA